MNVRLDLSEAEVITVRVALRDLIERMSEEGVLGLDTHGEIMRNGYVAHAKAILRAIEKPAPTDSQYALKA